MSFGVNASDLKGKFMHSNSESRALWNIKGLFPFPFSLSQSHFVIQSLIMNIIYLLTLLASMAAQGHAKWMDEIPHAPPRWKSKLFGIPTWIIPIEGKDDKEVYKMVCR